MLSRGVVSKESLNKVKGVLLYGEFVQGELLLETHNKQNYVTLWMCVSLTAVLSFNDDNEKYSQKKIKVSY